MNCDGVVRSVSSYIDGELEATVKQEFEIHISECPECLVLVRQTKYTVSIFYDSDLVDFPGEVKARLHQTLQRKIQRKHS